MNKVDIVINDINKRNFLTFFVLIIVSLFVSIFLEISLNFLNPRIKRSVFIGILALIILMLVISFFSIFSFFILYKEKANLKNKRLLKISFYLIISYAIISLVFIILIFVLNQSHQNILRFLATKQESNLLKQEGIFRGIKIIYLIANSALILNIITIVVINIIIKNKGGI